MVPTCDKEMGLVHQKSKRGNCIQNSEKQNDIYPHQANEEEEEKEEKEEGERREISEFLFLPRAFCCCLPAIAPTFVLTIFPKE